MYENHPTFTSPSDDAKIWRYIDLPKLVSLFERNTLFFSKVTRFEDPYEGTIPEFNIISAEATYASVRNQFQTEEQFQKFLRERPYIFKILLDQHKEIVLVNSWHLNEYESASMWKLYSNDHMGIAIQSSFSKLKQSFHSNLNDKIWIGKVNYLDFKTEWMNEWNVYETFLAKRKSFNSESELRAVTTLPDDQLGTKVLSDTDKEREKLSSTPPREIDLTELTPDGKYVTVDLNMLIEKIYISPLAKPWFVESACGIIRKYGIDGDRIIKSDLYSLK